MNGYLLDTDHFTLFEFGHPQVSARIQFTVPAQLSISPATVEEVMRGRLSTLARPLTLAQRCRAYGHLVTSLESLTRIAVHRYSDRMEWRYETLRKQFRRLGAADLRIAATALEANLTLVTRNRSDFAQIPGLAIEDWSA